MAQTKRSWARALSPLWDVARDAMARALIFASAEMTWIGLVALSKLVRHQIIWNRLTQQQRCENPDVLGYGALNDFDLYSLYINRYSVQHNHVPYLYVALSAALVGFFSAAMGRIFLDLPRRWRILLDFYVGAIVIVLVSFRLLAQHGGFIDVLGQPRIRGTLPGIWELVPHPAYLAEFLAGILPPVLLSAILVQGLLAPRRQPGGEASQASKAFARLLLQRVLIFTVLLVAWTVIATVLWRGSGIAVEHNYDGVPWTTAFGHHLKHVLPDYCVYAAGVGAFAGVFSAACDRIRPHRRWCWRVPRDFLAGALALQPALFFRVTNDVELSEPRLRVMGYICGQVAPITPMLQTYGRHLGLLLLATLPPILLGAILCQWLVPIEPEQSTS